jgi:hypothetical protein
LAALGFETALARLLNQRGYAARLLNQRGYAARLLDQRG